MLVKMSQREANAVALWLQLLQSPAPDPMSVVERLVVIQTQYARNLPDCLSSRARKLPSKWVDTALTQDKRLVKTWVNRGTVHTLRTDDLALVLSAVAPKGKSWVDRMTDYLGIDERAHAKIEDRILRALEKGPASRKALHDAVPELKTMPHTGWGLDVKSLAYKGQLVFACGESGGSVFASTRQWFGNVPKLIDSHEAQVELLRRFLRGHSPVSESDFRYWSGMSAVDARKAVNALAGEMTPIEIDGHRAAHFMLTVTLDALPGKIPLPPLRYLPKFDSLMLGYHDRARFMEPHHCDRVYRPAGQIEAIVLKGGRVAGTWRWLDGERLIDWL